jgi:hypothetical protein
VRSPIVQTGEHDLTAIETPQPELDDVAVANAGEVSQPDAVRSDYRCR